LLKNVFDSRISGYYVVDEFASTHVAFPV